VGPRAGSTARAGGEGTLEDALEAVTTGIFKEPPGGRGVWVKLINSRDLARSREISTGDRDLGYFRCVRGVGGEISHDLARSRAISARAMGMEVFWDLGRDERNRLDLLAKWISKNDFISEEKNFSMIGS
jgi:hypothetical protein